MEIAVCESLGIKVVLENRKGKHSAADLRSIGSSTKERAVVNEGLTLFYLPHCPYRLYCNLLWANWNAQALQNIYIIGNRCKKRYIYE